MVVGRALWFGNLVVGVSDLDAAAEQFRSVGLDVLDGGRHVQFGTANRVIPFGRSYLELLAVVDRAVAETTWFGRSLLAHLARREGLVRWSLRSHRLDAVAASLGLAIERRSRTTPGGRLLQWRAAGLELSLEHAWLPFFVEWPDGDFPGGQPATHEVAVGDIAWMALTPGDGDRLARWLCGAVVPLRHVPGEPGLTACGIGLDGGRELVVSSGPDHRLAVEVR